MCNANAVLWRASGEAFWRSKGLPIALLCWRRVAFCRRLAATLLLLLVVRVTSSAGVAAIASASSLAASFAAPLRSSSILAVLDCFARATHSTHLFHTAEGPTSLLPDTGPRELCRWEVRTSTARPCSRGILSR